MISFSGVLVANESLTLEPGKAIIWGSIGLALVALAAAYGSYHELFFSDDPVFLLSALLMSALNFLAAATVRLRGEQSVWTLLWGFAVLVVCFGVVNLASPEIQPLQKEGAIWARILNLSLERNLTTFFSSSLLGMAGMIALACYAAEAAAPETTGYRDKLLWIAVAFGFFFLALDETLMFHEKLNRALRDWINIEALRAGYWTFVYVPVALAVLGSVGNFFYRRFAHRSRERLLLVAGIFFWLCVPILEVAATTVFREQHLFKLAATVEEVCEMWGSLIFLAAFVLYSSHIKPNPSP